MTAENVLYGDKSGTYSNKDNLKQLLTSAIRLQHRREWLSAEPLLEQILAEMPDHPDALCMLGLLRHRQGLTQSAIELVRRAVNARPQSADLHLNLGNLLKVVGEWDEAIRNYYEALRLKPNLPDVYNNLGNTFSELGKMQDALEHYEKARRLNPNDADIHSNMGAAFRKLGQGNEAIACYRVALALRPDQAVTWTNLANALNEDGSNLEDSIRAYQRALQLEPDHTEALAGLLRRKQVNCDWDGMIDLERRLLTARHLESGRFNLFNFLSLGATPSQQHAAAVAFSKKRTRGIRKIDLHPRVSKNRIRIGYISADFRDHPVASLIAELLESHDRSRFEIIGYANFGSSAQDNVRARISDACDRFVDIEEMHPQRAAERIAVDEIDILVDLTGYTRKGPYPVLARRPAPIQISYLGYPGTMGASFIDYIITDKFVTPPERQENYSEKFVYMPYCFQVNDRKKEIAMETPTRKENGLPDEGFVFCCFNQSYKLTPQIYDVWMRLLSTVPGSVLWLSELRGGGAQNLQKEAVRRGVDPARIVFARRVPEMSTHLARYRLADLFLDTLPFNAHTTASDALWAGLPVLTCTGETYASRVAGSLLRAVGLPELITNSIEEYESLAIQLSAAPLPLLKASSKYNLYIGDDVAMMRSWIT